MSVTNALDIQGHGRDGGAIMAEVRADGVTTRYRRAGSGSPLLLLCDVTDERFAPLVERLAESWRVIAPLDGESDRNACTTIDCLEAFMDGLGVGALPVVGVGRAAGPAAGFARLSRDRVTQLVLLGEDVGEPEHNVAAVVEALIPAEPARRD